MLHVTVLHITVCEVNINTPDDSGVSDARLPDTEQTRGMVSSLWVMADSVGGYLGDTIGSIAYDTYGFQSGTVVMFSVMVMSVLLSCLYILTLDRREVSRGEKKHLLKTTSRHPI